jgi:O-acetylserine/cysteine efflux transporter
MAIVWGSNFVAIRAALDVFPPLFFNLLRFALAALPAVLLPVPPVPWPRLIVIGLAWYLAQFGLLFLSIAHGMPPGLASVVVQSQAFFTIVMGALVWRERPSARQAIGTVIAFGGLSVIAADIGGEVPVAAFLICVAAAFSWAVGNLFMRDVGPVDLLPLVVWLSVVPLAPNLLLVIAFEGPQAMTHSLANVTWIGIAAVVYNAVAATWIGYGIWGYLLKLYPMATVAPFSLLVPVFGMSSTALVLGERFAPLRLVGVALILAGLSAVALPPGLWSRLRR